MKLDRVQFRIVQVEQILILTEVVLERGQVVLVHVKPRQRLGDQPVVEYGDVVV